MAEHNTMFSEGSITGILIDFVKCVREMVMMGNTVKMAQASIGNLAEGAKTGAAVKVIKLLAQSTGDFTREELKKDAKLAWTDKTKAEIAAAKGESGSASNGGSEQGSSQNGGGTNQGGGGNTGGNQGDNNGGGGDGGDDLDKD